MFFNHKISIVVPVFNEEDIISEFYENVSDWFKEKFLDYEIIFWNNGSKDKTAQILKKISSADFKVKYFESSEPNYGFALKRAILEARFPIILVLNSDFIDYDFVADASSTISNCELVLGSKNLHGEKAQSQDNRSLHRKMITKFFSFVIRKIFKVPFSDTHGLKLFRNAAVRPVVLQCRTAYEIFDTELLIRAYRAGFKIRELPVKVDEKRPSRYSFLKRARRAVSDLHELYQVLQ